MPTAGTALPGRGEPIPTAETNFVTGRPLKGPFPDGTEQAMFGMGCFWGVERKFWKVPGVTATAVGYAGGETPNPTYQEVCSGATGHNEVVLVSFDPKVVSYETLLKTFWEGHDPTQGMRQGNDVGTQYRSGIYALTPAQKAAAAASKAVYQDRLKAAGLRKGHDGNPRRAAVLLCRGLPSAVPGQEPGRLLRSRRHWRHLPDRGGDRRLTAVSEPRQVADAMVGPLRPPAPAPARRWTYRLSNMERRCAQPKAASFSTKRTAPALAWAWMAFVISIWAASPSLRVTSVKAASSST